MAEVSAEFEAYRQKYSCRVVCAPLQENTCGPMMPTLSVNKVRALDARDELELKQVTQHAL